MTVSERMLNLGRERSVIRELFEYGKQRAAIVGKENVFDFSLGNPSVVPPEIVNETAIRILRENPDFIHCYTSAQGDFTVRQRFADSLNQRNGTNYTADEFYVTVGAAAALCCVFSALACRGDEFVAIAPYFPEYKVFVESTGAKFRVAEADMENFQINFEALDRCITKNTKAVIINSPNNPSGVIYSKATLEKLAALLEEKSREYGKTIYLISDEPYREIVFGDKAVPWVPSIYKNTIVCYSFSKSLSLPGERLGYVLVPSTVCDVKEVYAAVAGAGRSLGYVNAPSLFQQVCSLCCDVTADIAVYERNCELLTNELSKMGYSFVKPDGAFYLLLKAFGDDDLDFSQKAKEFDILLVPGSGFGAKGYVRLAYCVETDMILRALPRFKELAESYK